MADEIEQYVPQPFSRKTTKKIKEKVEEYVPKSFSKRSVENREVKYVPQFLSRQVTKAFSKNGTLLNKPSSTTDTSKNKSAIFLSNLPKPKTSAHSTKVRECCLVPVEEVNKLKQLIKTSKETQLLARSKSATDGRTTINSVTRSRRKVILESMKNDYEKQAEYNKLNPPKPQHTFPLATEIATKEINKQLAQKGVIQPADLIWNVKSLSRNQHDPFKYLDHLPDDGTVRDQALKDIKTCQRFSLFNNHFGKISKKDREKYFQNSSPRIQSLRDKLDAQEMEQDMKGVYFPKKDELEQMEKFINKNSIY